ncbi:MAG: glycosyltransferase family protein [Deltaproteobacteria bacterium]|nr:glycosyltransferase family protein [Deltaproteobacteria bacterium]
MSSRVVIIVQARMSSSRLPGKVLMPLAGRPALVRLMERMYEVSGAAEALVATSVAPSDDAVTELCAREGIRCQRGSLDDVLLRYHSAARAASADVVVRITGDCPLHDPAVIDECIGLYHVDKQHVAYVSNVDERTYPDGLDVEVASFAALDQAQRSARSRFEREHVTPWIRRHCRKRSMVQAVDLSDLRWTLEHREDYQVIAAIYDALANDSVPPFGARAIYQLLLHRPNLILTAARRPLTDSEIDDVRGRITQLLSEEA